MVYKNMVFRFLTAAVLVLLLIQVAGATVDYTCYYENTTGMDEATDEELINAILGITPEPPEIVLRGKQAPSADTWTKSNLIYTLDNNSCSVTKYTGNATDLLVPVYTEIDGVSYHTVIVSNANNGTFANNTNLVSVQFGNTTDTDSITFITNSNAPCIFKNDSNLESVSFFAVNTSNEFALGWSFENCTVLYNVYFQPGMRIGGINGAFSNTKNPNLTVDFSDVVFTSGNMSSMFNYSSVSEVVMPSSPYAVSSLQYTFRNCINLRSIDLSNADISNCTTMNNAFINCYNITAITLPSAPSTKINNMAYAFQECKNLTSLTAPIDTSNVTNMTHLCTNMSNVSELNLSTWNTSKVQNMTDMFSNCTNLSVLSIDRFDTSSVTNMRGMLNNCTSLTSIDLSNVNTSSVTDMSYMFNNSALTTINVTGFDTSNTSSFRFMFGYMGGLSTLDISSFDMSSATDAMGMFSNCRNLTSLSLPTTDTPNLNNCANMFENCSNITDLSVPFNNTSKVTTINRMFSNMTQLRTLDVSAMQTGNVTDIQYAFQNCVYIESLNLSSFNTSSVTKYSNFITNAGKLEYLDISSFNLSAASTGILANSIASIRVIKTPHYSNGASFSPNFYFYVNNSSLSDFGNVSAFIDNGTMTRAFNMTAVNPTGATISVQPHAAWNSSVPLSATLSDGYVLTSWNVTDQNGNSIEVTNDSFTMPFANVTVRANTERPQFSVTVVQPAAGATISASSANAYYNDTITLSSNVQTGYVFNSWNVTDENGTTVTVTGNTFQMPMSNVTVRAIIDHPLYTITVIQPSEGGTISASALSAYYNDTVNLTYVLDPGYKFSRWNITDEYGNNVSTVSIDGGFFRMPAGNVTVTTTFDHFLIHVSVVQPTGATISASPTSGYYGDIVTLSAAVQPGYSFNSWNVTTEGGESVPVTGNMFTILPETLTWRDYITVRANVEHVQYSLTVIPTAGINVTAPATAYYLNAITLNKSVDPGYRFVSWNVTTAGGDSVPVTGDGFSMPPDNVTIQANSEKIVYNVTESQTEGGSVIANRTTATYGDTVSLSSVPSTGYQFSRWNVTADGGVPITVTENTFQMPAANVTVSAVYDKIVYNVSIITNTAGTITTNRSNATYGDLVSITATPVTGFNFESWNITTDGGQSVSVTGNTFVMPASNVSVAAVFSSASYNVTVVDTPGGNTSVSQYAANAGTVIWITAEPDSGYIISQYTVRSDLGDSIYVENGAFTMPTSNVLVYVNYSIVQPRFTTTPGISFTPTHIVLNYTSNARSNDTPEFVWEASADNFTTIANTGTVSGGNGSITFASNLTSGNMTVRMRPAVGSDWVSITISLSTEVIINVVDGVDGMLISTGARFTAVPGLVTPSAAVVNAVLNNSTMTVTTSGGNTTRMRQWSTTINAFAGETLTFSYSGGLNSPWSNVTYVVTIPSTNTLNITLPRQESGYAGTIVYYTDGGQPVPGIPVNVYDSSYNDLGTITTYAGGQAVYVTEDFSAVYFDVNTSGYTTNTKVVAIPSTDSVYLGRTRTITIKAVDAGGGQFIPGFTTYLGVSEIMKSTDNGTVTYTNVEDGSYSVIISASGYYQVTREIEVSEQNTDFVLQLTLQNTTSYTTPNFVRLIYTDIYGNKLPGLTINVVENTSEIFTGTTGADGSVSLTMNQTKMYKITATNSAGVVVNTLTLWPQYSEYAILVTSPADTPPAVETAQLNVFWKTDLVSINASTSRLNLSMKNANVDQNVTYVAILKNNTTALNYTTGVIDFGTTTTINFTVPNANETYLLEVTYTDENGNSRTVTSTIKTDLDELKLKYEIPGFTAQWHYDALCVFIVIVTSFLFSQQTKHIGGLIIPLEAAGLYAIGWLRYSGFAICMCVAVAIMALILFVERMDRERFNSSQYQKEAQN